MQTFFANFYKKKMYNTNLIRAIDSLGLENPVTQIHLDLKVSKGTVSSYYSGKIKASKPFLVKFANFYRLELNSIVESKSVSSSYSPQITQSKGAPYYDVDFIGGFHSVNNDQTIRPAFYIDFMPYNDVDCWVNVTGKSMSPFISHGDIVALKKVENWREFLLFGEIYAIVTHEFRTIKIVGKSELKNHFKLIPYSKSPEFSEQDLPIKLIEHVYRVKGSLKKFF